MRTSRGAGRWRYLRWASPSPAVARRRGTELSRAIYAATLAELADSSFEELSFDRIALRAGAGKASLYRRWTTPTELLLDALTDEVTGVEPVVEPHTGSLRGDLLAVLGEFARALDQPYGRALGRLMPQRDRHPEVVALMDGLAVRPRIDALVQVLRKGSARGEADPDTVTERTAGVGVQMIVSAHLTTGTVEADEVASVVDEVLLRLVAPRPRQIR